MTNAQAWSPEGSRFATARELEFEKSTLTFTDGVVRWSPVGLQRGAPGSAPFQVTVGTSPGAARELCWVHGGVANVRFGTGGVNILAVCGARSGQVREVLGFVPAQLAMPYVAMGNPDQNRDLTIARARGIAEGCGLAFTEFELEFGSDPNLIFPGVMPGARSAIASNRFNSWYLTLFGIAMLVTGVVLATRHPVNWFFVVALVCGGPILSTIGWVTRKRIGPGAM